LSERVPNSDGETGVKI